MNSIIQPSRIESSHRADPVSDPPELGFSLPPPAHFRRGRLVAFSLTALVIAAVAFALAFFPRRAERAALARAAADAGHAPRRVTVVVPKPLTEGHRVVLTGNVQPLEEATINARATGYVRRWLVDMGAHVEAGTVLAVIDTPEVDQELLQAQAALAQAEARREQARATREFSKSTFERTRKLTQVGVAAQQELEASEAQSQVGVADLAVAEADVAAQRANIRRLQEVKRFSRVTAPFAGTITSRAVERGDLIAPGTSAPLFRLAATDTVRIFVQVPQSVAPSVTPGLRARVGIREYPGRQFEAAVARTSGALDPGSRTLSAEIRVANREGTLLTGMYAEVELELKLPHRVFELSSTTLLSDARGLRMAIVNPQGKIELRQVTLERDLGPTVQVASGLDGSEKVVQIASADLTDGEPVAIVP